MINCCRPGCVMQSKPFSKKSGNPILKPTQEIKQEIEVQGSHRTLFYRQPSKKHVSTYSTIVVDLEGNSKKVYFEPEKKEKKEKPTVVITLPVKSEKMMTKGTQTDFRESETQTFPWRHKIQVEEELLAELLSLDWFSLERNFPLGREEVMLIEQTRQKLAWENIIRKLKGKENEIKRKSLLLRMSTNETAFRESRKDEENRERLEKSRREWEEIKRIFETQLSSRLLRSYVCRRRENETKIRYWNHQLARKIRKVKSAMSVLSTKPDIIAMHKDKSSALYAPKLRDGASPFLGHEIIDIQCRFLKRFHGDYQAHLCAWGTLWGSSSNSNIEILERFQSRLLACLEILEKHMMNVLYPKLPKLPQKTEKSKSKKLEFSFRKFLDKEMCEADEKMSDNSSVKIAVPASTPEPATTSRTELPANE